MIKRPLYTALKVLPALLLVMIALSSVRAQVDTVYTGQTSHLVVEEDPGISYTWELYNDVAGLNLAVTPGNCPPTEAYFVGGINTGDSVEVMWLMPGTYFFKVTASNYCVNNLRIGMIEVLESMSTAYFLEPDSICPGDTAWMTIVLEGGIGPWEVEFTDGTNTWIEHVEDNPHTFQLIPTPPNTGTYTYWITSVTSGTGLVNEEDSDPVTLIVMPQPTTSPIYRYEPTAKK